jgi:hypothetical protein
MLKSTQSIISCPVNRKQKGHAWFEECCPSPLPPVPSPPLAGKSACHRSQKPLAKARGGHVYGRGMPLKCRFSRRALLLSTGVSSLDPKYSCTREVAFCWIMGKTQYHDYVEEFGMCSEDVVSVYVLITCLHGMWHNLT